MKISNSELPDIWDLLGCVGGGDNAEEFTGKEMLGRRKLRLPGPATPEFTVSATSLFRPEQ